MGEFTGRQKERLRVYCGGTFDLFHKGHVNFLKQCARLGEVWVSLNTDEFIEEFKGGKAVMDYEERKEVLESCQYVEKVFPNSGGEDSKPAIIFAEPNIVAIGTDWAGKDYYEQMGFTQEWLDERKIVLAYLPYTQNISTTDIKKRL